MSSQYAIACMRCPSMPSARGRQPVRCSPRPHAISCPCLGLPALRAPATLRACCRGTHRAPPPVNSGDNGGAAWCRIRPLPRLTEHRRGGRRGSARTRHVVSFEASDFVCQTSSKSAHSLIHGSSDGAQQRAAVRAPSDVTGGRRFDNLMGRSHFGLLPPSFFHLYSSMSCLSLSRPRVRIALGGWSQLDKVWYVLCLWGAEVFSFWGRISISLVNALGPGAFRAARRFSTFRDTTGLDTNGRHWCRVAIAIIGQAFRAARNTCGAVGGSNCIAAHAIWAGRAA